MKSDMYLDERMCLSIKVSKETMYNSHANMVVKSKEMSVS